MSQFLVSARKYRPDHFNTVLGQKQVTETLKNAIRTGQLAQSFLFCGPRGVGKTSCARILAKTINCTNITPDFEACGTCESCISFQNGNSFNIQELDAASNNSVEDIRSLVEQIRYAPQSGKYKIYIIDEVHMLSQNAFNAFLKTLEEPPSYVIFILATTEKQKIIPTILSRCQIFDFNRITVKDAADHLAHISKNEGIGFEPEALHLIAQKSDGAMRDALSIFDQLSIFTSGNITYKAVIENLHILDFDYYFKVTQEILAENIPGVLLILDEILQNGFNGIDFLSGLSTYFRDLLVCKDETTVKLLEVMPQTQEKYILHARLVSPSFLLSALSITNQAEIHYRNSKNQRLHIELALMKLCHIPSVFQLQDQPLQDELKKKRILSPEVENALPNSERIESETTPKFRSENDPLIESLPKAKVDTLTELESILGFTVISTSTSIPIPSNQTNTPEMEEISSQKDKSLEMEKAWVTENPKEISKTIQETVQSISEVKSGSSIRIKIPLKTEILNSQAKEEDEKISGLGQPKKSGALDSQGILNAWNKYLKLVEKQENHGLFTILENIIPVLGPDALVTIGIQNLVHKNLFLEESDSIVLFLREELQNDFLHFDYVLVEKEHEKSVPFTAQDKLRHLAEINPLILTLKNQLGLEIDY